MNLEHLSKDKEERKQQIALIIHNCQVYGVKIKQELIDEYNKLNK
jgi:hypothetical protein